MYKAEVRKILSRKEVTLILVLFLLSRFVFSLFVTFADNDNDILGTSFPEEDPITTEEYHDFNNGRINALEDKLIVSSFSDNETFLTKSLKNQIEKYQALENIEITITDEAALTKLVLINQFDIFWLLFIIWLALIILKGDQDEGLISFIRSLPAGRGELIKVKIIVLSGLAFVYAILIKIIPLLTLGFRYTPESLSRNIQSNPYFKTAYLEIKVTELILYDILYFVLIAFSFIALSLFVISLTKKRSVDIIIISVIFIVSTGLYRFIPGNSIFNLFKYLNLIACADFFGQIAIYKDLSIANMAVPRLLISNIFLFCVFVFFFFLAGIRLAKLQKRKERHSSIVKERKKTGKNIIHRSLLLFEINRVFLQRKLILVFLIPVILQSVSVFSKTTDYEEEVYFSLQRITYVNAIKELSGELTDEKELRLNEMIEDIEAKASTTQDQRYQIEKEVLYQIKNDFADMKFFHEDNQQKLYVLDQDMAYKHYEYSFTQNLLSLFRVLNMLLLSVWLIGPDKVYELDNLLFSTPSRFGLRSSAHFHIINTTALIGNAIYSCLHYYEVHQSHYALPLRASIQSVKMIQHLTLDINLGQLELLLFLRRYISFVLVALLSYFFIKKIKKLQTSLFPLFIVILLPTIAKMFILNSNILSYLPWTNILGISSDLKTMSNVEFVISVLLITFLSFIFIVSIYLYFFILSKKRP